MVLQKTVWHLLLVVFLCGAGNTTPALALDGTSFISKWETTTANESITLPLLNSLTYQYDIDCNNDNTFEQLNLNSAATCTYTNAGTHIIKIRGTFPAIYINNAVPIRSKLLEVIQWGNISWQSMSRAFYGANRLIIPANDIPDLSKVSSMESMFHSATTFNQDISTWDVSTVTNMSYLFNGASAFNQDLNNWDVSQVTDMRYLFSNTSFNSDVSDWNVSAVTNMQFMFYQAGAFNQDISAWHVSNVTTMESMFNAATTFNQKIGNWNVAKVNDTSGMFASTAFNQDISNWNVSAVTNMRYMFHANAIFDQDIGAWDVSQVTDMSYFFNQASAFDQDLNRWNVSQVTDMRYLFSNTSFNSDVSDWNVSAVTNMQFMFYQAGAFNQDISAWNVSNVTTMESMFNAATTFNQKIGNWNVAKVNDTSGMFASTAFNQDISNWNVSAVTNMRYMFHANAIFDQDIGAWDVSQVTDMSYLFNQASAFNQDLNRWNVNQVTNMSYLFNQASAFDQDLNRWDVSQVTDMRYLFSNTSFNSDVSDWNVSAVTNMQFMFYQAGAFNQDISAWNVSNVTTMESMFNAATTFNKNIGNWNVAKVNDTSGMFASTAFNQDISNWDVSAVTNIRYMFHANAMFNQNIVNWDVSQVTDMSYLFNEASAFNQDIGTWNVSQVTNMGYIFNQANSFDQDISAWNVSQVNDMSNMFAAAGLSVTNYDALLLEWNKLTLQSGINFHAGTSQYHENSSSSIARSNLIDTHNWTITDGGKLLYSISIAQTSNGVENNTGSPNDAIFTITVSPKNLSNSAITGEITYTGSASNGIDYSTGATTFSIANNQISTTINLEVIEDEIVESTETITATLLNLSQGELGISSVTSNLVDDDLASAEIKVLSDNTEIISGDTSPRRLDNTDFGVTSTSNTFTIQNIGEADLILSATPTVTLSSNSSSAFKLSQQASTPISGSNSTTFSIDYTVEPKKISTATVIIANNDTDEALYRFNIQGGENSISIPPRIEKLRAFLASDLTQTALYTFQNSGGNIKFSFEIIDSDSGNYNYVWTSTNSALNNLLKEAEGIATEGTVSSNAIDISELSAGKYPISVVVSDSTFNTDSNYVAKSDFVLRITSDTVSSDINNIDTDSDGIVDANDNEPNKANNISAHLNSNSSILYKSKVPIGYRIVLGTTAIAAEHSSTKITASDLNSYGNKDNTTLSNQTLEHIFDYIIEGIAVEDTSLGKTIMVVLPLESVLTENSAFYKYNTTDGWSEFKSDAYNQIEWANWDAGVTGVCPDPDSTYYNNTNSKIGKTCLGITLQDGGANDADGKINGQIVDPFGISTPILTVTTPTTTTTTITTTTIPDPCANAINVTGDTFSEGNCDITNYFVLTLEPALAIDTFVNFATRDGSAKAGEDYIATSGIVTLPAGETQILIPVNILGDEITEDDESFEMLLSNPIGASFSDHRTEIAVTHTILNDDNNYYMTTPNNVTVETVTTEGVINHVNYFKLTLDQAYTHDIFVSYHTLDGTAIAGNDYIAVSRKLKVSAGQTEVMMGVEIMADNIKETDETFSLVISNPIGQNFSDGVTEIKATHTIIDDD